MAFADLQSDRPVLRQIGMRAPKEPKRRDHHDGAAPWRPLGKVVISETQPGCEQVQHGHEEARGDDDKHEDALSRIKPIDDVLIAFGPLLEHASDGEINDKTDEKNHIPWAGAHTCSRSEHEPAEGWRQVSNVECLDVDPF